MSDTATLTRYRVEGMDCGGCARKIDTAVRRMPGVADVTVSVTAGTMNVQHDDTLDLGAVEKRVTGLGYQVAPWAGQAVAPHAHADDCGHNHDHAGHDHDHAHAAEPKGMQRSIG